MLHFIDFEVFKHDWLVVIKNPVNKTRKVIINDKEALEEYYNKYKNEIFLAYNGRQYDQYIFKGILCGFDPYKITEHIIVKRKDGWRFSDLLRNYPLNMFDLMPSQLTSLKTLEAFMGHNIKETSVPFNIDRKLTKEELDETIFYCEHDVDEAMEVFIRKKEEFDTMMFLIKTFKLPLSYIGKTKAQAVAAIVGGNKKGHSFDDEFDYKILDCIKIDKYKRVYDFYKNAKNDALVEMQTEELEVINKLKEAKEKNKPRLISKYEKRLEELNWKNPSCFRAYFYSRKLELEIAGVPHTFAWGGIHGAIDEYSGEGYYLMMDVEAYYPSQTKVNKFGYRVMDKPENFELIHDENIRLKHEGTKKERQPFKIADNSLTGQFKDPNSSIYDPMANNCICVNGQLMLLDLIEKLEGYCQLIQSNTDGICWKLNKLSDFEIIDDIVYEWEKRTGMVMEFELYKRVYQKDVNNYCMVSMTGKMKTKGAYVKGLNELDNDLPIINKAMVDYMVNGAPVEKTIGDCDELIMFQKVVKVSSKYMCGWHNGQRLNDKTFRVFASKDSKDTYIGKQKSEGATIEKFANTPDHCFIENGDIVGVKIDDRLDKTWYVELTLERLRQFGVL